MKRRKKDIRVFLSNFYYCSNWYQNYRNEIIIMYYITVVVIIIIVVFDVEFADDS